MKVSGGPARALKPSPHTHPDSYPYTPPHQPLSTAVATLQWVPPEYVDWYVNVEPIEPELTQLIYVWTNKLE